MFKSKQKQAIIEERYSTKIILVTGLTRAGKTSNVTAREILDYKYNNKYRMKEAQAVVDDLHSRGFKKTKLKNHVYYSNYRMNLHLRKGVETHHVRFDELGLPNQAYETMNLCPGAVVIIDEPDAQLNAREGMSDKQQEKVKIKTMNDYLHGFLKFHGQLGVTLILITQDGDRLDKIFRHLIHEVIYIYDKYDHYNIFKKLRKTTWTEWHYKGSRKLIEMGIRGEPPVGDFRKYGYITESKFSFKGNIHKYYNSNAYSNLFLYEDMEYEYREHRDDRPTAETIEEYKNQYSYTINRKPKAKISTIVETNKNPRKNDDQEIC